MAQSANFTETMLWLQTELYACTSLQLVELAVSPSLQNMFLVHLPGDLKLEQFLLLNLPLPGTQAIEPLQKLGSRVSWDGARHSTIHVSCWPWAEHGGGRRHSSCHGSCSHGCSRLES